LPIGNLTSQLFGNVYLNEFDHFIKCKLGFKYYGRYVDDCALVHQDKEHLKSVIPILGRYLKDNLQLELHPKKIYLQHFSKGVNFLGAVIKPHRIYVRNRMKGNFYKKLHHWNEIISKEQKLSEEDKRRFMTCVNSYLGMFKQYNTFKLRKKLLKDVLARDFWKYFHITNCYGKINR